MTPYEYLRKDHPAEIPDWLDGFTEEDGFSRRHFFASRIVYYPGSCTDGHPVKLFGSTHSAHCFVYVDFDVTQATIEGELDDLVRGFRGYSTLARIQLSENDLAPKGWTPHILPSEVPQGRRQGTVDPFGFLEVLEREPGLDDGHGPRRLAILFLGADGIAAYDALFCQGIGHLPPYAVLLQDHGFGGNYDRFGRDGLLERIARRCNVIPRWLLVGENSSPWAGFDRVADVDGDTGGMHASLRFLYQRIEN